MCIEYELKKLVGQMVTVVFTVADSGIVLSKSSYSGILKGRTCKHNHNNFDLFAIKSAKESALIYISLRQ